MITQVFIVGSSLVYGVGGESAGWADLIKQYLHGKMYAKGGAGEKYEVYNFGKSGATIDFTKGVFPQLIQAYGRGQKVITVASVGGNNSKAEGQPDNYVSTPEEYAGEVKVLLALLKEYSDAVILVGSGYIDESKTNPKTNPLTGGLSYFSNQRREQFAKITKRLCAEAEIDFVDVGVSEEEWLKNYLYEDGVHPNQAGHQLIFEVVKPLIEKNLEHV